MVTHNLREVIDLSDRIVFLTERPAKVRGVHALETPRKARDVHWRDREIAKVDALY